MEKWSTVAWLELRLSAGTKAERVKMLGDALADHGLWLRLVLTAIGWRCLSINAGRVLTLLFLNLEGAVRLLLIRIVK